MTPEKEETMEQVVAVKDGFDIATCREAMGIDWMTTDELNDAIPPAYTQHIGEYLLQAIQLERAVA